MSRIVIVGEAWGKQEEEERRPFVGASGQFLNSLLAKAGIRRSDCFVTNVFNLRPQPTNDVSNLCGPKAAGIPGYPALTKSKYVLAQYAPELERLFREIRNESPNLIIAFGNTPLWALCRRTGITKFRGAPLVSHLGIKVLPTYHPAAVLRQYKLYPVIYADLKKAAREAEFPELRRPPRTIFVPESIEDLEWFEREHIDPSPRLAVDIETKGDQITEVGFAPSPSAALVVPFWDRLRSDGNYWPSHAVEREAWLWIWRQLRKGKEIVGQNFSYDMQYFWRRMGFTVPDATHDTMLLHHALQPEMEKGLGFLGSIYTDEPAWKFLGRHAETLKKED